MATKKTAKNVPALTKSRKNGNIRWYDLNKVLRETEDLKVLQHLLSDEQKTHNRGPWLLRIHQRYNQVRREQEQRALLQQTGA